MAKDSILLPLHLPFFPLFLSPLFLSPRELPSENGKKLNKKKRQKRARKGKADSMPTKVVIPKSHTVTGLAMSW